MIPAQIIAQKRDGQELSDAQIRTFIEGYSDEQIPDYQMSALAMAIFLNGMTVDETASLTQAMLDSGKRLQWPNDGIPRVDKHSTGGVGDKISIPLAPLLASCGFQVPMLSGRGLGTTGGTLDKLESIPGFRTDLSLGEIVAFTQSAGCVITGASTELAPADRRLYALRDVTATVPSIPLITASIMSKKLAESLDALVLDVKFGNGAFMKTKHQARQLAESLVSTGRSMGVPTTAVLTDMHQPLGRMCGNSVEILESLDVLRGKGPGDVTELVIALAAELLVTANVKETSDAAVRLATEKLRSGAAYESFCRFVSLQGGDAEATLPIAPIHEVKATKSGVMSAIDTERLGLAIIEMGGGRRKASDDIDRSVGLEMLVKVGEPVSVGDAICKVFSNNGEHVSYSIQSAIQIDDSAEPLALIHERITG